MSSKRHNTDSECISLSSAGNYFGGLCVGDPVQDTERKWMANQEIVKALGTSGSFTRVGTPMPRAQRNDVSHPNQKKASSSGLEILHSFHVTVFFVCLHVTDSTFLGCDTHDRFSGCKFTANRKPYPGFCSRSGCLKLACRDARDGLDLCQAVETSG